VADRLSPLDASFLAIEDPVSHMHIGSVCIFEGPPPPQDRVLATIGAKLHLVPRYRQVVQRVPGELGRPLWVDDPHFNLEYHVRRTALPTPGGRPELRRLVGRLMSQQLDRGKPLWEIWVVEGLEESNWAMVCKTHHCLVDGVAGTELLAAILDLSPESEPAVPPPWHPGRSPSGAELVVRSVVDAASNPLEPFRALQRATAAPRAVAGSMLEVASGTLALAGLLRRAAPVSVNGPIGPHRRHAWAAATVEDVKTVRKALGGTFNDVVLACITSGFRTLLGSRSESTDRTLRTMVPVSVRARDPRGVAVGDNSFNNKVSAMFADLPVDIADPVERLHAISAQMEGLKESKEALAGEVLVSAAQFAPPMLLSLGTRLLTGAAVRGIHTITTNVPGPQLPLYAAGCRLLRAYPYVPLAGRIRVAVAIFSYDGQVTFGVTGDYDSVPDIEVMSTGIERGLDELLRAGRVQPLLAMPQRHAENLGPRRVRGAARRLERGGEGLVLKNVAADNGRPRVAVRRRRKKRDRLS
jgi:diacylglycerol O-acyltransferase / wax synthase